MYDVIVIGARVAGSPAAMLLARKGYQVLVVDRATFPSDKLSTHQVQIYGSRHLKRWGLLDEVLTTNCPPARRLRFDAGPIVLEGEFPPLEGIDAVYSPRRIVLDKLLVDAARAAGAEVREGFSVDELLIEDGRVAGLRGKARGGGSIAERARLVIGADGLHSIVARSVRPETYDARPALTCAYYTYFDGVPVEGGEIYTRDRRAVGVWPTHDGLTLIYTAWPIAEFHRYRADIEGNFLRTLALAPALAERVRQGRRAERFMGTADLPNFYRKPHGPGWALVGDAGYMKDPITGLGISDAFRDAELLADAIDLGFSGRAPLERALADYEAQRNQASRPMYQQTLRLAAFTPAPPEQQALLEALRGNPAATNQFFGTFTGSVPLPAFVAPANLLRILGASGLAKIARQRLGAALRRAPRRGQTLLPS